jgi:phosphohistidine phosphatase SixA
MRTRRGTATEAALIRLYLIRHAADGKRAGARSSTARWRRRIRSAARAFAELEEPIDLICTSPNPQAKRTAEILARALDHEDVIELEELSPRGPTGRLLRALAACSGDGDGIVLVGHKRQLRELFATLGLRKSELPLRPASVLRIDVDALPRPRTCIPRFRLRPSRGGLEDAFLGLRKVG